MYDAWDDAWFADVPLDPAVAQALERFVAGYSAHIVAILRDENLDEPICSVAISQGQEPELDAIACIYAGRQSDRERVLREDAREFWTEGWNVYLFRDEDDIVHPAAVVNEDGYVDQVYTELVPDLVTDWETVRDAIEERVVHAPTWVLARVAHRLNRTPLPIPGTDDLAVWLFEHDQDEKSLIAQLEFVLRPETLAALVASDIVR